MKKIIVSLFIFSMLVLLCGCGSESANGSDSSSNDSKKNVRAYTETQGDLLLTYIYDRGNNVISKNVYDKNTGITTDYTYFYYEDGWGKNVVGVNIVTITKDGKIIDQSESD